MPASPLPMLGAVGRIPSWKEAREQRMADTLEGMAIERGIAEQAAGACGDDLNAALDWARAHGAEPSSAIGIGIGIGIGSGRTGDDGSCADASDDDSDKENAGRVRVWNQQTCKYEWLKGIDAAADEEERQIGATQPYACHGDINADPSAWPCAQRV
jgi:hypothetical protein